MVGWRRGEEEEGQNAFFGGVAFVNAAHHVISRVLQQPVDRAGRRKEEWYLQRLLPRRAPPPADNLDAGAATR